MTGEEKTVIFRTWGTFLTCPARWNRAPLISVSVLTRMDFHVRRILRQTFDADVSERDRIVVTCESKESTGSNLAGVR